MAGGAGTLDVLLICPNYYSKVLITDAVVPPTNLAALAAYLRERGIRVGLIDGRVFNSRLEDYREAIEKFRPKIVGLTVMTSYMNQAAEIARVVKSVSRDIVVVAGGAHISALPEETLRDFPAIDAGVVGEGEITLLELAERVLGGGRSFEGIDGLCFRRDGEIVRSRPRALIEDLDSLPLPAYDLLPMDLYRPSINWIRKLPSMMVYTARGCPYRCTFCAANANFGRTVRFRKPEKIMEEIEFYEERYGIRQVIFYDDTLIVNKKQIRSLCDLLLRRKTVLPWGCFSTIGAVDAELARTMKKAGCFMIYFGLESGSDAMLKKMNKSYRSTALAASVLRSVREAGIMPIGSFMFGHPGDSEEGIRRTIRFALDLPLGYATFVTVVPFPGSFLFDDARRRGILPARITDWSGFEEFREPFILGDVPREVLLRSMRLAYRKFYFRLPVLWNILKDSLSLYKFRHNWKTAMRILKYAFRRDTARKRERRGGE